MNTTVEVNSLISESVDNRRVDSRNVRQVFQGVFKETTASSAPMGTGPMDVSFDDDEDFVVSAANPWLAKTKAIRASRICFFIDGGVGKD